MINDQTLEEIKKYPANKKIELIETLLASLKNDVTNRGERAEHKPFVVKKFSLGQDLSVDRDELYSDRGE